MNGWSRQSGNLTEGPLQTEIFLCPSQAESRISWRLQHFCKCCKSIDVEAQRALRLAQSAAFLALRPLRSLGPLHHSMFCIWQRWSIYHVRIWDRHL